MSLIILIALHLHKLSPICKLFSVYMLLFLI
jgi:hypothetical protein